MKKTSFLLILFLFAAGEIQAQIYSTQYRSPGQEWRELQTEHFRVIYPGKYHSLAAEALSILELEYNDIQQLVGGSLKRFPVILNAENDRSNGFVSPINFRSEIEIAPFLGKSLNPRSGTWFETVLPHELVHALHFSANPPSVVRPLGLFSPDLRRTVHGAAPFGFIEGIAVEHESHNTMEGAGRGNYPFFNHQFRSMQGAESPWSMGQLVHTSTYTPPFNRHYIGGYRFVNWLQNQHGNTAMREAIRKHYQLPFLGFGFALRRTTGEWPRTLYREFMQEEDQSHQQLIESLEKDTETLSDKVPLNASCRRANRPLWLDDDRILFYARSCNRPSGFYLHTRSTGTTEMIHEVSITGDHNYALSPDKSSVVYSRFHADPTYDNEWVSDIHIYSIESGTDRRVTRGERVVAPVFAENNRLLAARADGQVRNLVDIDISTGSIVSTHPADINSTVLSAAPHPDRTGEVALLGKKQGVQAIWLTDLTETDTLFTHTPDIVFNDASIFDPYWSEDGQKLLFTANHSEQTNLYEYFPETGVVQKITDSRYLAMEGTYSPDGQSAAYIYQLGNEQLPAVLNRNDFLVSDVAPSLWKPDPKTENALRRPLLNRTESFDTDSVTDKVYSTGMGWLKPRFWVPVIESEINDADRFGISLESGDVMSRNSYSLEATYFANSFWFDGTYRYTGTYPGFELDFFLAPTLSSFRIDRQDGDEIVLQTIAQRRGAALSVPFRYRIEQNTRFSSFLIEPEFSVFQTRFTEFDDAASPISSYGRPLYRPGLNTVLNLGLRQHTRDIQPNRGVQLFTQLRYGLNSSPFTLQLPDGSAESTFSQRKGLRAGATVYLAPLQRLNQSLRISLQGFTQTAAPVFNTQSVVSNLFDPVAAPGARNTGILDTRYTIPLVYPDDGGLLLPVYLSNIYMVLFSQTVSDLDRTASETRTVLGAGIRSKFKIGNLGFDLGISIGWEPARSRVDYLVGSF